MERKFASSGDRTHNRQVTSPTRSPLSHPGRAGDPRELNHCCMADRKQAKSLITKQKGILRQYIQFGSNCFRGFMPYQQYFSYIMGTVHKFMFPRLLLNSI